MAVFDPFDFFLEPDAEAFPFCYEACAAPRAAAVPRDRPPTPLLDELLARSIRASRRRTIDFLVDLNRRLQQDIRYVIRLEPGVQTPEQTLDARHRLLPRHRVAAGAAASPPRARGALRLGLSDPAHAPTEGARRPVGHRNRLHRPARVVRGLSAGRRLDRARSRRRACSPARATSRSRARPSPRAPRRSPARVDDVRDEFEHEMSVDAHLRIAARHEAVHRRAVGGDRSARPRGRRASWPPTTCA